MKIELECCEGRERYKDQCLKDRCPIYGEARREVNSSWPHVATGFGNLYGNPDHSTYSRRVEEHYRAVARRDEDAARKESQVETSIVVNRHPKEGVTTLLEITVNPSVNDWQTTPIGQLRVDPVETILTNDGDEKTIRLHYQEGSELRSRSNGIRGLKSLGYREVVLYEGEGWQQLRGDRPDINKWLHLTVDESLEPVRIGAQPQVTYWQPRPRITASIEPYAPEIGYNDYM